VASLYKAGVNGKGQVIAAQQAALDQDPASPALKTGFAPTTTDVTQLPAPGLPVTLTVGGIPAAIGFIGIPHGLVGVTQVNFTVPSSAPLGPQLLVVTVGSVASAPVTMTIGN